MKTELKVSKYKRKETKQNEKKILFKISFAFLTPKQHQYKINHKLTPSYTLILEEEK